VKMENASPHHTVGKPSERSYEKMSHDSAIRESLSNHVFEESAGLPHSTKQPEEAHQVSDPAVSHPASEIPDEAGAESSHKASSSKRKMQRPGVAGSASVVGSVDGISVKTEEEKR
jgi:hypothetical protein